MKAKKAAGLIGILFFIFILPVYGAGEKLNGENQPDQMALADQAYAQREDDVLAQKSLSLYQAEMARAPSSVEAYWKASRAAWWIGDQSSIKKDKIELFKLSIEYAKKGIELDPDSVESHFWLAGGYGSYGEEKGVMKSLFLLKPIRKELNEVIRLNPQYEGGGGYRVLGIIDYKVPGLAGGNKTRALERLSQAYEMDPQNPFTLFYLAEYHHEMGHDEQAKTTLETLFNLKLDEEKGPDLRAMQAKGRKLAGLLKP